MAVVTRNTGRNYGPGWEGVLLDAYGIVPDPYRSSQTSNASSASVSAQLVTIYQRTGEARTLTPT